MKKTVVVFDSKYGATKKYAQWIAEELACDVIERKNVRSRDLQQYETIVFGGGLYAEHVRGIDFLKKNSELLKNKKLVLFTCGLADPKDKKSMDEIKQSIEKTLTPQTQTMKLFHLRGAIDYAKLTIGHKMMMYLFLKVIAKKQNPQANNQNQMSNAYGKSIDLTDRSAILPIVQYVQSL